MFTGSICDAETARRANMSVHQAASLLGLTSANMTSLAAAQAQCDTGQSLLSICDRIYAVHSKRALKVGANFGATFASSLATYYSALPETFGHELRMIC